MARNRKVSSSTGGRNAVSQQSDVSKVLDGQARSAEEEMREANLRAENHDGAPLPEDTPAIEQFEDNAEPWGKAGS